ncbi:hypothetical protein AGABI1DRAFT_124781 [Agaricus bisporus var. burnettii JB137-S8]|uniref:Uncharacterized protein n=1 Tax=Agaricus bisporus var. burnettii (strain JB137-S8 / ATCC MYA-4627 / FGSC 10392) TaxID=597362 RepID=K5W644_AGABU|nr:uncharacterized protein AGABI1DRAFT_124781 [Agaricus bisporus var. burnettii JB137-S8]EKM82299.1 hypothetical protein AGABI1DRAFT_124781 [Agaricus bisporus var. burnettii JB137-S8]
MASPVADAITLFLRIVSDSGYDFCSRIPPRRSVYDPLQLESPQCILLAACVSFQWFFLTKTLVTPRPIDHPCQPPRAHTRLQHLRTPLNRGGLRELQDQGNSSFLKALGGWPERSFFIILGLGLRFVVRIPYLTRIPKVYALVMRILDVGERGLTWNMFSWSMSTVPSEPIPLIDQVEKVESAMISISSAGGKSPRGLKELFGRGAREGAILYRS